MNQNKFILSIALLFALSGCSTSSTNPYEADNTEALKTKRISTFTEQSEPTISIKPLNREQQEIKEIETLRTSIRTIPPAAGSPAIVAMLPIQKIQAVWTLKAGGTIGQELLAWGEKAGWKVIWNMPKDWAIPASTVFTGDFPAAASEVIKTLASNGALVRAQFFEGNKTMVVTGPGVAAQ